MPERMASRAATESKKRWFPRIKKLTPRGFLSFRPDFAGVELGDLNVFIGANGSGKSNFFESARFLQEAQRNVRGFLSTSSEVKDWVWDGAKSAEVEIDFDARNAPLRYRLGFAPSGAADVEVSTEALEFTDRREKLLFARSAPTVVNFLARRKGGGHKVQKEPVESMSTVLDALRHPTDEPVARSMREALASLSFFTEWGFGRRTNPLRSARATATIQGTLLEDGSNAALRCNTMLQRKGFRERLLEHLGMVLSDVDDALADFVMGSTQLVFIEANRSRRTPASRLSDGTLHWLFLGLILLDDETGTPLFLDEPELGLHPDAISGLGRLIREASARRQVILNTHSPLLLSEFTSTPECVYAFDRDQDGTRVERLDSKLLESWLGRGESLSGIWAAGAIGGNRW